MVYVAFLLIFIGLVLLWKAFQEKGNSSGTALSEKVPVSSASMGIRLPKEKLRSLPAPTPPSVSDSGNMLTGKSIHYEEQLCSGILYMDHNQISRQLSLKKVISSDSYNAIQRIATATLSVKNSIFILHSHNVRYIYPARELEQILFQVNGVAFIPKQAKQPVAIFLSKDVNILKRYIKKHLKGL